MKKQTIYLDNAASTPLDARVLEAMHPWQSECYGNSSGLHSFAVNMRSALDEARDVLARGLHARPSEIVFTSSATEANNLALKGLAFARREKGRHIILSAVEHASVFQTAKYLEKNGFEISLIATDRSGRICLQSLQNLIRKDTILISTLFVNNELGTIQPLKEIGAVCRKTGVYFHTDAVQGFARFDIDVNDCQIDLLSASAHKIYGPLGAGMLYLRSGIKIEPQLHGGGQEENRRSSTVNVPAVVGFAEAFKIFQQEGKGEAEKISKLKKNFLKKLSTFLPNLHINGNPAEGSPYILNLSFPGCDAELLAMQLDSAGIAVSTGSACASGTVRKSRVLQACKIEKKYINSAIRFSFGRFTTAEELDAVAAALPEIVKKVKRIS